MKKNINKQIILLIAGLRITVKYYFEILNVSMKVV